MWPAPGPTTHTLPAGHGLAEGSLRLALEPELDWAPLLMCLCCVQLCFLLHDTMLLVVVFELQSFVIVIAVPA